MSKRETRPKGMSEEQLAELCRAWDGVKRSVKWEVDLVYAVSGKMFAVLCMLGPERGRLSLRTDPDRYVALSEQAGMMPAPYVGRSFWISVTEPERFDHEELAALVRRSYELIRATIPPKAGGRFGRVSSET